MTVFINLTEIYVGQTMTVFINLTDLGRSDHDSLY